MRHPSRYVTHSRNLDKPTIKEIQERQRGGDEKDQIAEQMATVDHQLVELFARITDGNLRTVEDPQLVDIQATVNQCFAWLYRVARRCPTDAYQILATTMNNTVLAKRTSPTNSIYLLQRPISADTPESDSPIDRPSILPEATRGKKRFPPLYIPPDATGVLREVSTLNIQSNVEQPINLVRAKLVLLAAVATEHLGSPKTKEAISRITGYTESSWSEYAHINQVLDYSPYFLEFEGVQTDASRDHLSLIRKRTEAA